MVKQLLNVSCLTVVMGVLLASCSGKGSGKVRGTLVTQNDFESVLGWNGNADASLTTEKAHSGKYAVRVGPANEFGYTYIQTLGKMSVPKIKTVTVSAWVWVPSAQAASNLVVAISRSPEQNTPVFYGFIPLAAEAKKYKQWREVSKTFQLPDSVQTTNMLKSYLWRAGATENVYVDDMTLSVEN